LLFRRFLGCAGLGTRHLCQASSTRRSPEQRIEVESERRHGFLNTGKTCERQIRKRHSNTRARDRSTESEAQRFGASTSFLLLSDTIARASRSFSPGSSMPAYSELERPTAPPSETPPGRKFGRIQTYEVKCSGLRGEANQLRPSRPCSFLGQLPGMILAC
jgi:hypothetical protein